VKQSKKGQEREKNVQDERHRLYNKTLEMAYIALPYSIHKWGKKRLHKDLNIRRQEYNPRL
jgi:hypothetical protein